MSVFGSDFYVLASVTCRGDYLQTSQPEPKDLMAVDKLVLLDIHVSR
jgi:hypothetical protein